MDFSKQRDKTIILKEKAKVIQFFIDSIVFIECFGYLSVVHLINSDKTEVFSKLLKDIERELDGYGFCRINRNTLVNLKYFKSFARENNRRFITRNGLEMKVSRRKWPVFKEYIEM